VKLDLHADGAAQIDRDVQLLGGRLVDLRPAWNAVFDDFLALEEAAWETDGRALGTRWKPLSARWARWKAKNRPGAGLLEMQAGGGPLRKSLTKRGAPYQRLQISNGEIVMGTTFGIARTLQRGGTVTMQRGGTTYQANVPGRRMVRLVRQTRERWSGIVGGYVRTGSSPGRLVRL